MIRNLISVEDLEREDIERLLDLARNFTEVSEREVKKVPALRGRRVLNLFYEASTRTRSSRSDGSTASRPDASKSVTGSRSLGSATGSRGCQSCASARLSYC